MTLDATTPADAIDTYEYSALGPTNYTTYRVTVDGDGAEHIEVATVLGISGGVILGGGGVVALATVVRLLLGLASAAILHGAVL